MSDDTAMSAERKMRLVTVQKHVIDSLHALKPLFTDGMELTFIVRHHTNPEMEFIVTNDSLVGLRQAMDRFIERENKERTTHDEKTSPTTPNA